MAEAMSGLGGFAQGLMDGRKSNQDQQMFQLSMQEGQLKVEAETLKVDDLKRISDIQKRVDAEMQAKAEKAGGVSGSDKAMSMFGQVTERANKLIGYGDTAGGLDLLKAANGLAENNLSILERQQKEAAGYASKVALAVDNLPDEPKAALAEFDNRILNMQANGEVIPPEAIALARTGLAKDPGKYSKTAIAIATSAADKAKLEYEKARTKKAEIDGKMDEAHTRAYDAQAVASKARAEHLGKAGAGDGYTARDLTEVVAMAASEHSTVDKAKLQAQSKEIAEAAHRYYTTGGMSRAQALRTAYEQMSGDAYAGLKADKPHAGYVGGDPLPVPATVDQVKPGLVYNVGGKPHYWDQKQKGFVPFDPKNPPSDMKKPPKLVPEDDKEDDLPPGVRRLPEGGLMDKDGNYVNDKGEILDDEGNPM